MNRITSLLGMVALTLVLAPPLNAGAPGPGARPVTQVRLEKVFGRVFLALQNLEQGQLWSHFRQRIEPGSHNGEMEMMGPLGVPQTREGSGTTVDPHEVARIAKEFLPPPREREGRERRLPPGSARPGSTAPRNRRGRIARLRRGRPEPVRLRKRNLSTPGSEVRDVGDL